MNSRVFHWKNQQKNIGIFPGGMDDSEYPPANARCNLADSGAIGDLKPALCWPLNFFFGPQGASWSIRLQPVLFRCGCTQHALGVPWADSKLVFLSLDCSSFLIIALCNVNIHHKKSHNNILRQVLSQRLGRKQKWLLRPLREVC